MSKTRYTYQYATLDSEPTNPEWHRQVKLGKIIQDGMKVSLPVSLLDLERGFTTIPNILYQALHPESTTPHGVCGFHITNNLSLGPDGALHTFQLPDSSRQGMLQAWVNENPDWFQVVNQWNGIGDSIVSPHTKNQTTVIA